jgi:hypothetical protein
LAKVDWNNWDEDENSLTELTQFPVCEVDIDKAIIQQNRKIL